MKNKRGETLTETIIALTILAIGITMASSITGVSIRNMENSRNRIIAVNLAREGIEAVRNIRDSNWLKYSGSRRNCWYFMPTNNPTNNCGIGTKGDKMIAPGNYIVYKDTNDRWKLDISSEKSNPLSIVDINTNLDSDLDSTKNNDEDIYNHISTTDNDAKGTGLNEAIIRKTLFKRVIRIEYLDDNGNIIDENSDTKFTTILDTNNLKDPNRMRVTSTVLWIRGNVEHKAELKTHLTDYLGRTNLDA